MIIPGPFINRFIDLPKDDNGCQIWPWAKVETGYGRVRFLGRNVSTHRVAYELFIGVIPPGKEIDHLCNNRACVNPEHLEAVSHAVNVQRSGERKTHCKRGHDLSLAYITQNGHRQCRLCQQVLAREKYASKKVSA